MDSLARRLERLDWKWADQNPDALAEIETRIAETGSRLGLITYSDLVRGIRFSIPTIGNGRPFEIQVYDWTGLDRALIGEFLGLASARSYVKAKFMASALVVASGEYKPSWHFFQWMEHLNILPDLQDDTVLAFWADQVNMAHKWYSSHRL